MNSRFGMALIITLILSAVGQPVFAQDKPAAIVEAVVGQSGFIDEGWDYFRDDWRRRARVRDAATGGRT